jgi:hypothetical protein
MLFGNILLNYYILLPSIPKQKRCMQKSQQPATQELTSQNIYQKNNFVFFITKKYAVIFDPQDHLTCDIITPKGPYS